MRVIHSVWFGSVVVLFSTLCFLYWIQKQLFSPWPRFRDDRKKVYNKTVTSVGKNQIMMHSVCWKAMFPLVYVRILSSKLWFANFDFTLIQSTFKNVLEDPSIWTIL